MKRVAVLGLGNWGTALANHLAQKGCDVLGWAREPEIVEGINQHHKNPHFLPHIQLNPALHATHDLTEISKRSLIIYALPSSALSDVIPKLSPEEKSTVVSAVKGLEQESLMTPLQFIAHKLGKGVKRAALSGPSFSVDVAAQRPCGVVAASHEIGVSEEVAALFAGPSMRVYTSEDPIGVEVGGIVKNIIALAAGVSDGLSLGESARAGLICRGLAEMMRLAEAMGGKSQTLAGLSGLGDLAMTATSDLSRNRTVGVRLGKGETLAHIIKNLGSVAEAVYSAPLVLQLATKHGVEMPVTEHVVDLLSGKRTVTEMASSMLSRPIKREF